MMSRAVLLVLLGTSLMSVAAAADVSDVTEDMRQLRAALPDLSWRRLAELERLVERSYGRLSLEQLLERTGTLQQYRQLPADWTENANPTPLQLVNLVIALALGPYFTPMQASGISPQCLKDSWAFATSVVSNRTWALSMLDADGKLPDGIFVGNLNAVGSWDECLAVKATVDTVDGLIPLQESTFQGKHCRVSYSLPTVSQSPSFGLGDVGLEPILPAILDIFGRAVAIPVQASTGLCIPSSCSAQDLKLSLQHQMDKTNNGSVIVSVAESDCYVKDQKTDFSAGAIVMIVIMGITGILMVLGTFIDVIKDQAKLPDASVSITVDKAFRGRMSVTLQKTLIAFSVWTNGRKILDTSTSGDTLGCLHGLRFLSMTWVILGHQYIFGLQSVPWANQFYIFDVLNSLAFAAVDNASVSVDTFFFLSGLLVAYIFMRNMERSGGKFNIVMYYVHRYIRLTPLLAMVIGFMASLYVHLGDGPFWGKNTATGGTPYACSRYWWKNLLYINNIYESENMCLGQSWYLANDMQMFVASPIVLLPLYFYPTLGQIWLMLLLAVNLFVRGYITSYNDLGPNGGDPSLLYFVPWSRYGVYLVGIYTGWFLHRRRRRPLKMTVPVALAGWALAALTGCLIVYGLKDYHSVPPTAVAGRGASIIYSALNRSAWGACLAWVVIACVHGYGGFINTLLSWKAWIPLSRVTYATYLVSIDVQIYFYATLKTVLYFDQTLAVFQYLAVLFVSIPVAAVFSLSFEAPMMALEKIIFANVGAVAPKPAAPAEPPQQEQEAVDISNRPAE